MVECLRNVLTKGVTSTAWGNTPATAIVRVRPQEIAHWTFMRHLLNTVESADMVKCIDRRREATMKAEDLLCNAKLDLYFVFKGDQLAHVVLNMLLV